MTSTFCMEGSRELANSEGGGHVGVWGGALQADHATGKGLGVGARRVCSRGYEEQRQGPVGGQGCLGAERSVLWATAGTLLLLCSPG